MADMTREQIQEFLNTRDRSQSTSHYLNYLGDLDLSGLNLSGLDLSHLDVQYTNFTDCNMRGVNLNGSFICGTNFRNADLTGVSMVNAKVIMADFPYANMTGANLSGIHWIDGPAKADFTGANLTRAKFTGAKLDCVFILANLTDTQFDKAQLSKPVFVSALMSHTSFVEVDLRGVRLHGEMSVPSDKQKYPVPEWCKLDEKGYKVLTVTHQLNLKGALWDSVTFG